MDGSALERWALAAMERSEGELLVASVVVTLVGFLVALAFRRDATWTLWRAPYFVLSGCLYLLGSLATFAWLLTAQAVIHGLFWLLSVSVMGFVGALGFVFGVIAHARSMSAYGSDRYAFLGFVPIANLALLLRAPKDQTMGPSGARKVANGILVVLGLFLFGLSKAVDRLTEQAIESAARTQSSMAEGDT